jgi:hypothetical protein
MRSFDNIRPDEVKAAKEIPVRLRQMAEKPEKTTSDIGEFQLISALNTVQSKETKKAAPLF